jgi:sodium-independent sulfate anion transporter 11
MARYGRASLGRFKQAVARDPNIGNFRQWCQARRRSARGDAVQYLREKIPIAQWLPGYSPSWLVNDVVAGLTIGCLLVPQSLAYANIAKLPAAYGLLSSWLPMLIYTFMGTSKGETAMPSNTSTPAD